ncbi:MAG: aminotransferase class I/II-fold pyridoxal phosphate-dependent enzyme, partial [Ectothiorhodospiraceae bacterium]
MTDAATFNRAVHRLAPPPISSVQQWAKSYSGDRGPLVDLAQAVPGYPPHQDLLRWLADAAGRAENCGYGPIEGEPELRHAYARHVTELYGAGVGPSNIHITAGCNQAFVAAVMAIAEAGESVLLVTPFYFNHATSLEMLGIHPQLVKSRADAGFVPDPEAIEAAIHPGVRALALVTPNNPTGAVYPRETV